MKTPTPLDQLLDLVETGAWETLARHLQDAHPADIAEIIDQSPKQHHGPIFALVAESAKPDVLAELEAVAESDVVESLSNVELSDIVEDMAPDDAADVLADMPDERSAQVLELMDQEDSEDLRKLLQYKEDSAGGIMTTDVVSMLENQSVQEALHAIAYMDTRERFHNANIVDPEGCLIGYVEVWNLLRERQRERPLGELVQREFHTVRVDMDQEEAAQIMHRYDLSVLPVVDARGVLVGRITADDVIDVIEEEASEDIFHLAGSDDLDLTTTSPLRSCVIRLPWLLVTLVGGFLAAMILQRFHARVSEALILAAFVPIVMAMGGNTGIQSSTLVVRSLALGTINRRNVLRLLLKEVVAGAIMGLICGIATGVLAVVFIQLAPNVSQSHTAQHLASIVAISLATAMSFAAIFGASVPMLLHRLRVDPAVASGPFVTITNDIFALLIYFLVTTLLVQQSF